MNDKEMKVYCIDPSYQEDRLTDGKTYLVLETIPENTDENSPDFSEALYVIIDDKGEKNNFWISRFQII